VLNALEVDPVPLVKIDSTGEYIDYELGGYNPIVFGGAFDVVEYGGLKHEVDARTGEQLSVRDRNDNQVTLGERGHSYFFPISIRYVPFAPPFARMARVEWNSTMNDGKTTLEIKP
jgi:hypothetical protein